MLARLRSDEANICMLSSTRTTEEAFHVVGVVNTTSQLGLLSYIVNTDLNTVNR